MDCTATQSEDPDAIASRKAPLEDWSALVTELTRKHGMSQRDIAAHCHCSQTAISELAKGTTNDPRHRIGEALRALRTAKRRDAAEKAALNPRPDGGAVGGLAAAAGGA